MRYVLVVVMTVAMGLPCALAKGKWNPGPFAAEVTTPLVPGALAEVVTGLDQYTNPYTTVMICLEKGKGWIGNRKIKMFEGAEFEKLPEAAADLVARLKDDARKKKNKVKFGIQFALAPDTRFEDASILIAKVLLKGLPSAQALVAVGKDKKLGLIPLHLPRVALDSGEKNELEKVPGTVEAVIYKDRVELKREGVEVTVANPEGKDGPAALADAMAGLLPKGHKRPTCVFVMAKLDTPWQRVLQVAGVVRGAFAGWSTLPGVVLVELE